MAAPPDTTTLASERSLAGASTNAPCFTTLTGCPFAENKNSLTAGRHGPALLQDTVLLEKLQQFDREKIPARNVHALGTGAHGCFTVTHDIAKYTRAALFNKVGKTTEVFARLSGVFTEQGDADTMRDVRGLAVKFYTEQGNWDVLCTNFPVFGARDAKIGPDVIHAFKRDPRTAEWFPTQTWDFIDKHPEGLHQALMLYSDLGTPLSYRHQHFYACNTYSMVNEQNQRTWVKFHFTAANGAAGLTLTEAKIIAGEDPNWLGRDLRESIERGDFPRWTLAIQVMSETDGYRLPIAFDATKVWPHTDYPLIPVGTLELNRNVSDYFAETEQAAFSPANAVPGIGFSPDRLLQGRLFLYTDTQLHRLGPNYKMLPINVPHGVQTPMNPYHAVGGQGQLSARDKFPHYYPSALGKSAPDPALLEPPIRTDGPSAHYDLETEGTDEDYYGQARIFWFKVLTAEKKERVVENLATSLAAVTDEGVVKRIVDHLAKVDEQLSSAVSSGLAQKRAGKGKTANELAFEAALKRQRSETRRGGTKA